MKRVTLIFLAISAIALGVCSQRTTRRGHSRMLTPVAATPGKPVADTITGDSMKHVSLSGFDKTLSSRRESFFISNTFDKDEIVWVSMVIDYLDMSGRQLHQRRVRVRCEVPPGQTRRVDIPAWDIQKVYYYYRSEPRRRVMASAAPFDVAITIDSIAVAR